MPNVTDHTALLSAYIWNGSIDDAGPSIFISYSFELTPPPEYLPLAYPYPAEFAASFRPLTDGQQASARAAFTAWDDASGVTFFEVPSGLGDIKLASFDFLYSPVPASSVAAYAFSEDAYSDTPALGIVYVNTRYPPPSELLFLHEIGHVLGLKHPFEDDPVLVESMDNTDRTVMSYTEGPLGHVRLGDLDLAAIRQLYGTDASDGSHVAAWSWDAANHVLTLTGLDTDEYLKGVGARANILYGRGGDDMIDGASGADVIWGGEGRDFLYGYSNNDHIYGQSPNGGPDGADLIFGGDGGDYLQGNAGNDTIYGENGSDRILGGQDDDRIFGEAGNDSANGNLGADTIDGGEGNDSLRGGQGDDRLIGGTGDDALLGDLGDDTLVGGTGIDRLTGGAGSDRFVFASNDAVFLTDGGIDTILDFASGADRIALGFTVSVVLTGKAGDFLAAAELARRLMAERAGDGEVAAITVGTDKLLFFSGSGGADMNAAIRLTGAGDAVLSLTDFG